MCSAPWLDPDVVNRSLGFWMCISCLQHCVQEICSMLKTCYIWRNKRHWRSWLRNEISWILFLPCFKANSLLRPLELLHVLAFLNGGMNKPTKFQHFLQFNLHKFILINCFVPHLNEKYLDGLSCYKWNGICSLFQCSWSFAHKF